MDDIAVHTECLVGMPLEKAKDLYGRSGWLVRCVKRDGQEREVVTTYMPTRINVETVDGVITKVRDVG